MSNALLEWDGKTIPVVGPHNEDLVATTRNTYEDYESKDVGNDDFVYFLCKCPRSADLAWACKNVGPGYYQTYCRFCDTRIKMLQGLPIGMDFFQMKGE